MTAIAIEDGVSFLSRLFKRDLDSNGWFVEFVTADGSDSANDNVLFVDEDDLGMEPKFIDREAFSVIGLRRTFAVEDSPKVPGLWQEVHALWPLLEPLQTDAAIGAVVMYSFASLIGCIRDDTRNRTNGAGATGGAP